jgi:hypothetical protein
MMTRVLHSKSIWTIAILGLFSAFAVRYALSDPNGITGVSKTGCFRSGCHHSSTASSSTTVRVSTTATTIEPGKQYDFRIVIHHPTNRKGGCDISVDGGTLAVSGTGSGLSLRTRELTQTTPKSFTGDSVVWNFKWTAPTTVGTYHIYAAGNAVNGNGTDDSGDQWNVTTAAVTVGASGPAPKIALTAPTGVKTRVGTTTSTRVIVRNTGTAPLVINQYSLRYSSVFFVTDSTAHTVAANSSDTVVLGFTPTKHQQYFDSLIVYSNDLSAPRAAIAVVGNGTQGVLRATPSSYDFGKIKLGDARTKRIVISNSGDDSLIIESLAADASTQFTVQSIVPFLTLPAVLAPNDSVAITVAFQPTLVQKDTMAVHVGFRELAASRDTTFVLLGEGVPPGGVAETDATIALRVFPNPAMRTLGVESDAPIAEYSIVDARGNVVMSGSAENASLTTTIDIGSLASGSYWLRLAKASGDLVRKFVIER